MANREDASTAIYVAAKRKTICSFKLSAHIYMLILFDHYIIKTIVVVHLM